jgi:hypothetical protein
MKGLAWLIALLVLLYWLTQRREGYCPCGAA